MTLCLIKQRETKFLLSLHCNYYKMDPMCQWIHQKYPADKHTLKWSLKGKVTKLSFREFEIDFALYKEKA